MSSLFEGWLQLYKGRRHEASPTVKSADLFVYESCASLGPLSASDFIAAEVRLLPSGSSVQQKVLHVHGRFCVLTRADGSIILQIDIQRFVIMENMNPLDSDVPGGLCSSVTVQGDVISTHDGSSGDVAVKFFMLKVSERMRDSTKMYTILSVFFAHRLIHSF